MKKLKDIKKEVKNKEETYKCVWYKRPFVFLIYIYCFIYTQFFWAYHMVNFLVFGDMSVFDVEVDDEDEFYYH